MPSGRRSEKDLLSDCQPHSDVREQRLSMGEEPRTRTTTRTRSNPVRPTPTGRASYPNPNDVPPAVTASPAASPARPRRLVRQEGEYSDCDDRDYQDASSDDESLYFDDADFGPTEEQDEGEKVGSVDRSAMTPDNILTPWIELKSHLEDSPCPKCLGKRKDPNNQDEFLESDSSLLWRRSLEAECFPWGAMTDIVITCSNCQYQSVVCPPTTKPLPLTDAADLPRMTRQHNRPTKYKKSESRFNRYPINYQMIIMLQHLGWGLEGLSIIFSFMGLAPSKGGERKWKMVQDAVGVVEHSVYTAVCKENMDEVAGYYEARATEELEKFQGTPEQREAKKAELLCLKDGRIGIEVGMDGAWQRRSIGFGKMNSFSGMNFCVDLNTNKILNLVVYFKKCTFCQRWPTTWRKRHVGVDPVPVLPPVPAHRCSQNFNPDDSSKSMEADASCLHKEDIELKPGSNIYIHTLCTDDDSSVRANTKYNMEAYYDNIHGAGNWTKSAVGWPSREYTHPRTGKISTIYDKDYGKLNLQCYPIVRYTTDINHRVRCIGKGLFALKSINKKIPPGKLSRAECYRLKGLASLYLKDKDNRDLPFAQFCTRAQCMYLHHFDDHAYCNVKWCRYLQCQLPQPREKKVLSERYLKRFRNKELDSKTYKALLAVYTPYVTEEALFQCYHGQDTNKNESLNRKCSATAPKDRYFSGTMNLDDRFRYVAVHDSIGYKHAVRRIFLGLGINIDLVCPVLVEYGRRVDNDKRKRTIYINQSSVKRKRTEATTTMVKRYQLGERKAEESGKSYATGMAVQHTVSDFSAFHTDRSEFTLASLAAEDLSESSQGSDQTQTGGDDQFYGTI